MLLDRFSLTDKVAVVTGAGRGIGAACALGFAEAGADVVIAARTKEQLEDVANQVADHGRRALGVPCDVSDLANLDLIVDQAMNEFGRIDVVVNNAGGAMPAPFMDTSEKALEGDRKSTRLNSSHTVISYAVFCLKKKKKKKKNKRKLVKIRKNDNKTSINSTKEDKR